METRFLTLALDCSVQKITLALIENGQIKSALSEVPQASQAQTILQLIDQCLKQSSTKLSDIKQVLFCKGPGSFTALRIALATVMGLFWQSDTAYYETSSLLFRCSSLDENQSESRVATTPLGRNRFAVGTLLSDQQPDKKYQERVLTLDELSQHVNSLSGHTLLCGRGLEGIQVVKAEVIYEDIVEPCAFIHIINKKLYKNTDLKKAAIEYMIKPDIG